MQKLLFEKQEMPILMAEPMVKAILEGRKTQTRRPIRSSALKGIEQAAYYDIGDDGIDILWATGELKCPYGQVGDSLLVVDRIALEITGIQVERVNCMTEKDAASEGLGNIAVFTSVWNSLYDKKGFGWSVNPWCWVISFKLQELPK